MTDPKGDDDYFSSDGTFLESTEEGNLVKVKTDTDIKLITDFNYSSEHPENIEMMLKIQSHYASQVGISQNISEKMYRSDLAAAYYRPKDKNFGVVIDANTGKIHPLFANTYETKNTWYHEKKHEEDPTTSHPLKHVQVVIDQANHDTFKDTSTDYKHSTLGYAENLLNQAMSKSSMDEICSMIDKVNDSSLGEYGFFEYNSQTNKVERANFMDEVDYSLQEHGTSGSTTLAP